MVTEVHMKSRVGEWEVCTDSQERVDGTFSCIETGIFNDRSGGVMWRGGTSFSITEAAANHVAAVTKVAAIDAKTQVRIIQAHHESQRDARETFGFESPPMPF